MKTTKYTKLRAQIRKLLIDYEKYESAADDNCSFCPSENCKGCKFRSNLNEYKENIKNQIKELVEKEM